MLVVLPKHLVLSRYYIILCAFHMRRSNILNSSTAFVFFLLHLSYSARENLEMGASQIQFAPAVSLLPASGVCLWLQRLMLMLVAVRTLY